MTNKSSSVILIANGGVSSDRRYLVVHVIVDLFLNEREFKWNYKNLST